MWRELLVEFMETTHIFELKIPPQIKQKGELLMGKYKFGKPNKEISIEEFIEFLNIGNFVKVSHKAFFVLIF